MTSIAMTIKRVVLVAFVAFGAFAGQARADNRVTLEQVPAPVRRTVERESAGGQLKSLEREREHGRTYYEAEIKKGDREFELKVNEDGRIVSRAEELGTP